MERAVGEAADYDLGSVVECRWASVINQTIDKKTKNKPTIKRDELVGRTARGKRGMKKGNERGCGDGRERQVNKEG